MEAQTVIANAKRARRRGGRGRQKSASTNGEVPREVRKHELSSPSTAKIRLNFTINRSNVFTGTFIKHKQSGVPINLKALESMKYTDLVTKKLHQLTIKPTKPEKTLSPKKNNRNQRRRKVPQTFDDYVTEEEVTLGIKSDRYVKGLIRVNAKNFREAYVTNYESIKTDYVITTVVDRNRAFDGDEVVLEVTDRIRVVFISKRNHPRTCVGYLKPLNDEYAEFQSRDAKIPKIRIPKTSWPNGFSDNPKNFTEILFLAKINEWTNVTWALGTILETLGQSYDLKIETLAILKEFSLEVNTFENYSIPPEQLTIPSSEYLTRLDLTKDACIFTIDPSTAKDLDDAVSCKILPNGNYEIGVHISDVSYYLPETTELDLLVRRQATTIYMVDKAYHMLPAAMCQMCSLLPGDDKLAFSVIWEMTVEGEIVSTKFTRTVINSCCQLAYEHAQNIIDDVADATLPTIRNNFTQDNVRQVVKILYKMSLKLRRKRMEDGALRIDQIKINFRLDPETREPIEFDIYENKESHRLIEEFMLLANVSVAHEISEKYPQMALLRLHEPPKAAMMDELQKVLETVGIHVDITSSKSIQMSLAKYENNDGFLEKSRMAVLNHLFAKPMTRARYFCQGQLDDPDITGNVGNAVSCDHYALSVPLYTHFTSPIRRYADIMVHRLLAASLHYRPSPTPENGWTVELVGEIAANCNLKKYNAKRAGETCSDLFLAHYVDANQPFIETAVVVDVKERSVDVIVLATGTTVRLYTSDFGDASFKIEEIKGNSASFKCLNRKLWRILVTFPQTLTEPPAYVILEMFTLIRVALKRKPRTYKFDATLLRPAPLIE